VGEHDTSLDQPNRLKTAIVAGVTSSYAYDGDGKRASQTVAGVTTRSVYDVGGGLPVLLDDGSRKYVWGLGLAYAVSGSGIEVYHTDGLGSVRALTNGAGALVQTQATDEFGVPTATLGSSGQPFGYTGEQRDATGLVYLRARMYDPATGRFVQRDVFAGALGSPLSLHRYAYVENNPVNATDPSGLVASKVLAKPFQENDPTKCLDLASRLMCPGWQALWSPWGALILAGILKDPNRNGDDVVNQAGKRYPRWIDPRTGRPVPFPSGPLARVAKSEKVTWTTLGTDSDRAQFIAEWHRRGYAAPSGGWQRYDIHHIKPREFGGTNEFENLVPVERGFHQQEFNDFWRNYP
jgi:RHS repeat-associated protein